MTYNDLAIFSLAAVILFSTMLSTVKFFVALSPMKELVQAGQDVVKTVGQIKASVDKFVGKIP